MTKEERQRLDHIREGLDNEYYQDVDPIADFQFLWEKFQQLLQERR